MKTTCIVKYCLLFSLIGCSRSPLEDCYKQGCYLIQDLADELYEVHTLEDLRMRTPRLKKTFRQLTKLMIQASEYHDQHPHIQQRLSDDHPASDKLYYEMTRILEEVEGSREYLEMLQLDILDKLDAHQRKLGKHLKR